MCAFVWVYGQLFAPLCYINTEPPNLLATWHQKGKKWFLIYYFFLGKVELYRYACELRKFEAISNRNGGSLCQFDAKRTIQQSPLLPISGVNNGICPKNVKHIFSTLLFTLLSLFIHLFRMPSRTPKWQLNLICDQIKSSNRSSKQWCQSPYIRPSSPSALIPAPSPKR